uniref:Uncharacterized protein n=1 Tax=Anguilla anguilla TaxID=7936 RepID=A0A0E9SX32_ANGAN
MCPIWGSLTVSAFSIPPFSSLPLFTVSFPFRRSPPR